MAAKVAKTKLRSGYWDIYYGRDDISLVSVEELPGDDIGVRIVLRSDMKDFSHFIYSVDGSPFRKSEDGGITIRFKDEPSHQAVSVQLKVVREGRGESKPQMLNFQYYSKSFYEANRMGGYPNVVIIESSPALNFHAGSVEDWAFAEPTPEEKVYASKKWGRLIESVESEYERAKILAKSLMEDLWPHNGWPSDDMKVPPFEQYERMISGKDMGYCSNFANVFVCACNALGIPARVVGMGQTHSSSDKCRIQRESTHTTSEVFDSRLDQWIWMDLRFYALGAFLGKEGPLNTAELHLFLNQQTRRKRLRFHIYNMEDKSEKRLPLNKCPKKEFGCYEGRDTEFHYGKENIDTAE